MNRPASLKTLRLEFLPEGGTGKVALVTIDSPPVNAGSIHVRRDLFDTFTVLTTEKDLAGVILTGANGNFVAGSDIREFDAPPVAPHLPEVIAVIEALSVPVVAAIEGAALGGGYELALGCDYRLAAPNAVVGLPEVTLGLVPGAGGTFRLPRLVGPATAIGLITSGRRVKAEEAVRLGMVDAVEDGDLIAAARRLIAGGLKKRIVRELPARSDSEADIDTAEEAALRKATGAIAVAEAIAAVKASLTAKVEEALASEREASLRLRRGPQSQALRHLFLAERAASRPPAGATARAISKVGVAGAGRMGVGIALAFASRGFSVRLAEQNAEVLAAADKALADSAKEMAKRGRVPSAEIVTNRISGGPLSEMADCDLVVEAITEDMSAKIALFAELAEIVPRETILASNTSYLDINQLAAAVSNSERVAGLHFFNPAHIMRLVEVVQADKTSADVVATLLALCRKLGKVSVVARVGEGFIGNRIFNAYRNQCEFLLEEGAYPGDIDRAMTEFGMAMGPFAVFDLAGLDVAWAMRKRLAPTRRPDARYVPIPDTLCEEGRFGRKSGKGWYDYSSGTAMPDPHVHQVIDTASLAKGMERKPIPPDLIRSRLLAAMVNEAAWALEECIAARGSDIDLVLVNGYGFPALKGGLLHWAARQPRAELLDAIKQMAIASGPGIRVAPNLENVLKEAEAV
jgi:3-hydroxyacyl-CoA dehydrogenase